MTAWTFVPFNRTVNVVETDHLTDNLPPAKTHGTSFKANWEKHKITNELTGSVEERLLLLHKTATGEPGSLQKPLY